MSRPMATPLDAVASRRGLLAGGIALGAVGVAGRLGTAAAQDATPEASPSASPVASPVGVVPIDPRMQEVVDALASFNNPPVESVTPDVALNLPSFANALHMVEGVRGVMPSTSVTIEALLIPGPAGDIGGDPAMVAVMGERAGGNLATVVCLKARDEGGAIPIHLVLVYPVTTFAPMGGEMDSITLGFRLPRYSWPRSTRSSARVAPTVRR